MVGKANSLVSPGDSSRVTCGGSWLAAAQVASAECGVGEERQNDDLYLPGKEVEDDQRHVHAFFPALLLPLAVSPHAVTLV